MSISFTIRKQGVTDFISLPPSKNQLSCQQLKQLIIIKRNLQKDALFQNINILNPISGLIYQLNEQIPKGSVVAVQTIKKITPLSQQIKFTQTISSQQLDLICKNSKFFVIKSSNQQNIHKSRQHGVWATTYFNQDRLKTAFNYCPHVLLIFATNRSYQLKGIARMESQPSKIPDKSIWSGVSNIRLGGNFKIRWLRKKPINFSQVQRTLGAQVKDQIMRLSDGQQVDIQTGRKIASIFQCPKYQSREPSEIKVAKLGQTSNPTAGRFMAPFPSSLPSPFSLPVTSKIEISSDFIKPILPPPIFLDKSYNHMQLATIINKEKEEEEKDKKVQMSNKQKSRKSDKKHKQKSKKQKKIKKKRKASSNSSDEQSSSQSSSNSSSDSNSSSYEDSSSSSLSSHEKKKKRIKKRKMKKQKSQKSKNKNKNRDSRSKQKKKNKNISKKH